MAKQGVFRAIADWAYVEREKAAALAAALLVAVVACLVLLGGGSEENESSPSTAPGEQADAIAAPGETLSNKEYADRIAGLGQDEPPTAVPDNDDGAIELVLRAQVAMESHGASNDGDYTGGTPERLREIDPTLDESGLVGNATSPTSYTLTMPSGGPAESFAITLEESGVLEYACYPAGKGACGDNGTWSPPG